MSGIEMVVLFLVALPVAVAAFTAFFWAIGRLAATPDAITNGSLRIAGLWFVVWFLGSFCVSAAAMAFRVSAGKAAVFELFVNSSVLALLLAVPAALGTMVHARYYRFLQRLVARLQAKQTELLRKRNRG